MKKRVILHLLAFVFWSCSSTSEKKTEVVNEESTYIAEAKSLGEEVKIEKPVIETKSLEQKLNEAIAKKNEEQISSIATQMLSINSKSTKALMAMGSVDFKKGRLESAEMFFRRALKENPNLASAHNNIGLIYLEQKNPSEAIREFRNGLKIEPNDPTLNANLGSLFVASKDYTKGEIALETAIQSGLKDPKVLNNYAIALSHNSKIDEAEKIYERLLKDDPSGRDIMLNYSILLIDKKQKYKQGLEILNRLKFVGVPQEARNIIKDLETKANSGLNK